MRTINLDDAKLDLASAIDLARQKAASLSLPRGRSTGRG